MVVSDLVVRSEDLRDRRVRRIGLTKAGSKLIAGILDAGMEKQRKLLSRLSVDQLRSIAEATTLLVAAASDEFSSEDGPDAGDPGGDQ